MSEILRALGDSAPTQASAFARTLQDDSFDGRATSAEMAQFCDAASAACAGDPAKALKCGAALRSLKAFAQSSAAICFRHLNKNVIVFQLVLRVLKPERINQKNYGLCGPAHFAVLLAHSMPSEYVELAIQFMRDGAANHRGLRITVLPEILDHRIPSNFIPEADWVVAASLRNSAENFPQSKYIVESIGDSEQRFVLAHGKEGSYSGTPATMVFDWLVHAGYSKVVASMNFWTPENPIEFVAQAFADTNFQRFHPDRPPLFEAYSDSELLKPLINLHAAEKLLKDGWFVLMKVNESWSSGTASTDAEFRRWEQTLSAPQEKVLGGFMRKPKDNHWIFVKKIELGEGDPSILGKVQMTIYTYGAKRKVPPIALPLFLENYGGFVAAKG